jgi:hypothetical protein
MALPADEQWQLWIATASKQKQYKLHAVSQDSNEHSGKEK